MEKKQFIELVALLRSMQIYYHSAHHHASRMAFFADHAAFGDFYVAVEQDYDDAIERGIGNYGADYANLQDIIDSMQPLLRTLPSSDAEHNGILFEVSLQLEEKLIEVVEKICKEIESESDKQLFSEIGNKSKKRQYLIKRRVLE
jgi:DNA-binding ferritin-like protein